MEIFGVGASELVFILLIAIIILGPKDMQKAGRTIGRFLNQLVRSEAGRSFRGHPRRFEIYPGNLMREANMELQDVDKQIRQTIDPRPRPPVSSPNPSVEPGVGQRRQMRRALSQASRQSNKPPKITLTKMSKFFKALWRVITFPFVLLFSIIAFPFRGLRRINQFLNEEPPQDRPLIDTFSSLATEAEARASLWEHIEVCCACTCYAW